MTKKSRYCAPRDCLPTTLLTLLNVYLLCRATCSNQPTIAPPELPRSSHANSEATVRDFVSCASYWQDYRCRACMQGFQLVHEINGCLPNSIFFGMEKMTIKWLFMPNFEAIAFMQNHRQFLFEYLISQRSPKEKISQIRLSKISKAQIAPSIFPSPAPNSIHHFSLFKLVLRTDAAIFQLIYIHYGTQSAPEHATWQSVIKMRKIDVSGGNGELGMQAIGDDLQVNRKLRQVVPDQLTKTAIATTAHPRPPPNLPSTPNPPAHPLHSVPNNTTSPGLHPPKVPHYNPAKNTVKTKFQKIINNQKIPTSESNRTGARRRVLLQINATQKNQETFKKDFNITKGVSGDGNATDGGALGVGGSWNGTGLDGLAGLNGTGFNQTGSNGSGLEGGGGYGGQMDRIGSRGLVLSSSSVSQINLISQTDYPIVGSISSINGNIPQIQTLPPLQKPLPKNTPSSSSPSLSSLPSLTYIQYLDNISFLKTTVYESIRTFLLQYYPQTITQSQIIKISVADDQRFYFFQIVWQLLVATQDVVYYVFGVDKGKYGLEFLEFMKLPSRTRKNYVIDDNNRDTILSQLDPSITQITKLFIQQSQYYNQNSKLHEISLSEFQDETNTTKQLSILKYYYPPELNLAYEYAHFRYIINKADPKNSKSRGIVLTPVQEFRAADPNDSGLNQSISFYLVLNVVKDPNDSFVVLGIWTSTTRAFFHRVDISLNNKWILNYEIDENNVIPPRLRSNRSIDSPPPRQPVSTTPPILTVKNGPFPTINPIETTQPTKPATTTVTPVTPVTPATPVTPVSPVYSVTPVTPITPVSPPVAPTVPTTQPTTQPTQPQVQPPIQPTTPTQVSIVEVLRIPRPQSAFNLTTFLNQFPTRTSKPQKIPVVPQIQAPRAGQYLQSQIKKKIGIFFRTTTDAITDVRISNRETYHQLIDKYTVDYTEFLPSGNLRSYRMSRRCRFVFHALPRAFYSPYQYQYPVLMSTGAVGDNTKNDLNSNLNSSSALLNSSEELVIVSPDQALSKPIKFLAAIFNKTFGVQGTRDTAVPPIQAPILNLNDPRYVPTIMSAAGFVSNSDQVVNDFLTRIPQIIPLKFQQNPESDNPEQLALRQPQTLKPQTSLFLDQISTPAVYHQSLTDSEIERAVENKSNYKLISYKHAYYGDVRIWASLSQGKTLQINYTDNGYLVSSFDTKIIPQIPQIMKSQKTASQQINLILSKFNYLQLTLFNPQSAPSYKSPKTISLSDIIHWKYKRIMNITQLQFIYQFSDFIIKAGVMVDGVSGSTVIASLECVANRVNRAIIEEKRDREVEAVMRRQEWVNVEFFLNSKFGGLLKGVKLESVGLEVIGMEYYYQLVYLIPGGRTKINVVYNYLSKKVKFLNEYESRVVSRQPQKGCKAQNFQVYKCTACEDGLILEEKNGQCYERILNCRVQSGELCLACDQGFIVNNNYQCQ